MAKWLVAGMVTPIAIAHIFMWRSGMPIQQKIGFTILNAIGWTVVFVPLFLVDRRLSSIRDKTTESDAKDGSETRS